MRILTVIGERAQFIKSAALSSAITRGTTAAPMTGRVESYELPADFGVERGTGSPE